MSWSSKKQELVTLSIAEAEYVTATHTAKEAIWLCQLLSDILPSAPTCIPLHCNNQAAIKLATDDNYHMRTKHINMCYCFIHQTVKQGVITLAYCPTEDMVADTLTKALPCWKVVAHALALGIHRACGVWCKMSHEGTQPFALILWPLVFAFVLWPLDVTHLSYVSFCLSCTKIHTRLLGLDFGFHMAKYLVPRCSGMPRGSLVKVRKSK